MNKQELIKKIKEMRAYMFNFRPYIEEPLVLSYIEHLDEPQKPVIKQFVADLIEEARTYEWDLDDLFEHINERSGDSEISTWFYTLGNVDVLARAWLDGYEVEQEKRYLVKMKNLRALFCYLAYIPDEGYWTLMASGGESIVIKHTRKQLEEAGFGWVFDCPGIEIEEVQDDSKV